MPRTTLAPANSQHMPTDLAMHAVPASTPAPANAPLILSEDIALQPPRLNGELFRNTLFDTDEKPSRSPAAFWLRVAGFGLGAGLLVAAGYATAVGSLHERVPHLSQLSAASVATVNTVHVSPIAAAPAQHELLPSAATEAQADTTIGAQPSAAGEAQANTASVAQPSMATAEPNAIVPPSLKSRALVSHIQPHAHHAALGTKMSPAPSAAISVKPIADVASGDLPEQPSREAVQSGIEAVRSELAACAADAHGSMFADLTIAGSGRVSYSMVEGAYAGTPQGSCMARALRTAHFPQFSMPSLKVRYPFMF
jgi:hypothetical protein